jgi:amino acid transporter
VDSGRALNGWTMICAEMPLAAANDGLFPERFKRMSKNQVPSFGIIASTVLASVAMIINYLGSSGATVFTTLVLMTGITAAIPYGFSALAQLKWRWVDHKTMQTPRFAPRHDRLGAVSGVLDPVHLVLAQHRPQFLGLLGAILPGRRRAGARHPCLPRTAPPHGPADVRAALPVRSSEAAHRR